MKRIAVALLTCTLLLALFVPAAAEETAVHTTDEHLIVFYDFEGETPEEQLADKAPEGVSKEQLTLFTTQDEEGNAYSYIRDGVAHIASAAENYLICDFKAEKSEEGGAGAEEANPASVDMGKDLENFTGQMTVYTVFKAIGKGSYVDPIDVNHYLRTLLKSPTSTNGTMEVRFGETYDHAEKYNYDPADGMVFWETDTVTCAVTIQYEAEQGRLIGQTYLSFDGGKKYTRSEKIFLVEEDPFALCEYIMLGKLGAAKKKDKGTAFEIDEFRIYDTVLSELDILRINDPNATPDQKPDQPTDEDTTPVIPPSSGQITDAPDVNTAPKQTEVTTASDRTEKKGCASSLSTVAAVPAATCLLLSVLFLSGKNGTKKKSRNEH